MKNQIGFLRLPVPSLNNMQVLPTSYGTYSYETKQNICYYDLLVSRDIISIPNQSLLHANARMTSMLMMALCGMRASGAFEWKRNSFLI